MTSRNEDDDRWLTFGLAFVGGYCDATGFVLGGTFTGHVTGNLVLVAIAAVARDERSELRSLAAILTFLFGVALISRAGRRLAAGISARVLRAVLMVEVVVLAAASVVAAAPFRYAIGAFLVCVALAMGLQNGVFRRANGISVHTTYLTGMITALISGVAGPPSRPRQPGHTFAPDPTAGLLGGIWASFVLGAGAGAGMAFRFRGYGILGAALVLAFLTLRLLKTTAPAQ